MAPIIKNPCGSIGPETVLPGSDNAEILRLIRLADIFGARSFGGEISPAERDLLHRASSLPAPDPEYLARFQSAIAMGNDPFGEELSLIRTANARRSSGMFFTPNTIVQPMTEWIGNRDPSRIVDAGAGTGRFAAEAALEIPNASLIAVEIDPVASILCRAHLFQRGVAARVINTNFLSISLPEVDGVTAFIGNPPYVRHHDLSQETKAWAGMNSRNLGRICSQLAGLHVYFFLAAALHAREADLGCFITSAEWLDANYGEFLRWLLLERIGIESIHLLRADAAAFEDAMTTAAITCFRVGNRPLQLRVRNIERPEDFGSLAAGGRSIDTESLGRSRWGPLIRNGSLNETNDDFIPLREIARVHRGIATGANRYFVLSRDSAEAMEIASYTVPCITRANEISSAGDTIRANDVPNVLLTIPPELEFANLPKALRAYLEKAKKAGIADRYLCRHRNPWWSLGQPTAPPIVMTYMGRGLPAFSHNPDRLLLLNIAHGIYPHKDWTHADERRLVRSLNREKERFRGSGRTYHGGLEKFEPSEAEALSISPDALPQSSLR